MPFGRVKIKPADTWFSKCIREAADNTCERCGNTTRQMHCSHVKPRSNRCVRWDVLNAKCLCSVCHDWWHSNPTESAAWFVNFYGQGRLDLLNEKLQARVKIPHLEEPEIAKHYRTEHARLMAERGAGATGPLDVVSYH